MFTVTSHTLLQLEPQAMKKVTGAQLQKLSVLSKGADNRIMVLLENSTPDPICGEKNLVTEKVKAYHKGGCTFPSWVNSVI